MLKKENNVVPFLVQITHSREPIVGLSKTLADKTQPWKLTTKGYARVKYQLRDPY